MSNYLVTGGYGFIGSRFLKRMGGRALEESVDISKTDDFLSRDYSWASAIIHLAALTDVSESNEIPDAYLSSNVLGTINVLEVAKRYDLPVVFASTGGAIYPDEKKIMTEDDPINPMSVYGITKASAEMYIHAWQKQTGIPCSVLRFSNVYGGITKKGIIGILAHRFSQNQQVAIRGKNQSVRDYVHVDDVCNAIESAIGKNCLCNVSTGVGTGLKTIFEKINELIPNNSITTFTSMNEGEIFHSVLDPTRAQQELKWSAEVSIDQGLWQTAKEVKGLYS